MENNNLHTNNDTFLAQWLEGELSDTELKNRISEQDYKAFIKLRNAIEVSDKLNAPTKDSFTKIQEKIANKKTPVLRLHTARWSMGIAASILVIIGLFSIFSDTTITHQTSFGEIKNIPLLDGTQVVLNSKSTISYNQTDWKNNRQLTLDGEAYFKVEKGSTFTVHTTNGSVTVLGTQFNVNSTNDFFDVVCYEGKVGVKTNTSEHILLPSNSVRKINGNSSQPSVTQLLKPTWIDGESTFKSVPIKYVIKALEDQYNIKIDAASIDDTTIFSGSFPHNNQGVAFTTVFDALGVKYNETQKRNIKLRY